MSPVGVALPARGQHDPDHRIKILIPGTITSRSVSTRDVPSYCRPTPTLRITCPSLPNLNSPSPDKMLHETEARR